MTFIRLIRPATAGSVFICGFLLILVVLVLETLPRVPRTDSWGGADL